MNTLTHTSPTSSIHDRGRRQEQVAARTQPYVSDQPEALWYGDGLFEFHVPSEETGGQLSVFTSTVQQGFSPPRHIHTREDEIFLLVEGEVLFDLDGKRHLAGPGTSVYMPRGVPHTFLVHSPVAKMLGVMTPGGFEELFRNLGTPADEPTLPSPGSRPLDIPAVMAEQTRLGTIVVGPPMSADAN